MRYASRRRREARRIRRPPCRDAPGESSQPLAASGRAPHRALRPGMGDQGCCDAPLPGQVRPPDRAPAAMKPDKAGTPRQAAFVGDIGWDVTLFIDRVPEPDEKVFTRRRVESAGGVAANAAVACARAGVAARAWVARGDDAAGEAACAQLEQRHVALTVEAHRGATCCCVILLEPGGEKRLLLSPGVSMYPSAEAVERSDLDGVGWVHTVVYDVQAAENLVERCRGRGIPWSVDLEPATFAHGTRTLARCLDGAGAVFCNARAAALLGPAPVDTLARMGARGIVLSRGAAGASWCDAAGSSVAEPPAARSRVLDTTGAGDCLAGWFIAETLRGRGPAEALRTAVAAATLSCADAGAQPSFPTREAVGRLLDRSATQPEATV